MPHEMAESDYTRGEVIALVAPIVKMPVEDIDNVIIITVGRCEHCDDRNGIGMVETLSDPYRVLELLELGIAHLLERHMT